MKQEYSRVWIFAKLSDANERNDLQVVTEIYNKLQKGIFTAASQQVADFQKLLNEVVRLRERVKELSICIRDLKDSDSYMKVVAINNWDEYFDIARKKLSEEIVNMEWKI